MCSFVTCGLCYASFVFALHTHTHSFRCVCLALLPLCNARPLSTAWLARLGSLTPHVCCVLLPFPPSPSFPLTPRVLPRSLAHSMRYVAAYLLAALGGNEKPSADDIKKILSSVGVSAEDDKIKIVRMETKEGADEKGGGQAVLNVDAPCCL